MCLTLGDQETLDGQARQLKRDIESLQNIVQSAPFSSRLFRGHCKIMGVASCFIRFHQRYQANSTLFMEFRMS